MSLETGKIILKQSYENDSSGIINDLSEENGKPKSYARGNFNLVSSEEENTSEENTSNLPYYSSENIASIYKNSYFIKNVDPNAICKSNIYSFNKEDLLTGATDTKDSDKDFSVLTAFANFNDLSTMVVNAYLPLTNIRLAEFHIVNRINDGPLEPTSSVVNVFLTDKSILGTHEKNLSAINNINNNNSKEIIERNNFFVIGDVLTSVNALKTNLKISESYNDNENDIINLSTYDALNNICLNALNNIRVNLSCRFEDYPVSDYLELKRKLTYNSPYNSSLSPEKIVKEYENYLYTRFTIGSFDDIFGSYTNYTDYIPTDDNGKKLTFVGWTTNSESTTTVDYVKGDGLTLDDDYNLYPIFKKYYNVIYHYDYDKDNNTFSSITYTVECGKLHRILDYNNFAHSGLPDGVSFIGWTTTEPNENTLASSNVEYKPSETITKYEITTINLYAVGYKKEWHKLPTFSIITIPSNHDNIGHGYGNFYSTPTKLNTILTYCTQKGIKLPSINYLVGILCFTKQVREGNVTDNSIIRANCKINNTIHEIIKDRMGSTSRSTAYGTVNWKPLDVELKDNYELSVITNCMRNTFIPNPEPNGGGVSKLTTIEDDLSKDKINNIEFRSGTSDNKFFYSLEKLCYINKEKSIDPTYSYL